MGLAGVSTVDVKPPIRDDGSEAGNGLREWSKDGRLLDLKDVSGVVTNALVLLTQVFAFLGFDVTNPDAIHAFLGLAHLKLALLVGLALDAFFLARRQNHHIGISQRLALPQDEERILATVLRRQRFFQCETIAMLFGSEAIRWEPSQ